MGVMKRGEKRFNVSLYIITGFFLFSFSLVSAGFFGNVYDGLTGKATDQSTSMSVTVGNNAPSIDYVSSISAQDASEGGIKNIVFTFNASDADGISNLNSSTAEARFQKGGETTRLNTSCILVVDAQYECTIGMYYFDGSGSWTINVTIDDINGARAENSTTSFTYNLLTSMVMSPTALTWGSIGLTSTDSASLNNPATLNNTGNDDGLTVNVTGYDLQGVTTTDEYIYAHNYTVDQAANGCSGDVMSNATSIEITSALLASGNNSINAGDATSGQEEIYFCIKGLPQDISSQDYASGANAWSVQIIT